MAVGSPVIAWNGARWQINRYRRLSAYLHRHVAASGFRDGPFSVSGRASLCSLS
jgi:hypothetical protein